MSSTRNILIGMLLCFAIAIAFVMREQSGQRQPIPEGRSEVVFWHFWGGQDQDVVQSVVQRFNDSQSEYFVRAVAMPGNNLQAKLFLSVAGGDPPDLVNQDDPVLPDWSRRGVIQWLDEIADPSEVNSVQAWMLDSAQRLSIVEGRMAGVCNGLDIRALYYNKTALDSAGFKPPETIAELDAIATACSQVDESGTVKTFGYLPDSRRLWAWGFAFGGDFFDADSQRVELNTPELRGCLKWMTGYPARYGADAVAAFRTGDQSLPGKSFPLLPILETESVGRYVMMMDGQWRVRDITAFQQQRAELASRNDTLGSGADGTGDPSYGEVAVGEVAAGDVAAGVWRGSAGRKIEVPEFGVCPLPVPTDDSLHPRKNAGWVNGNFFVVPTGAKNPAGAWAFMKFWIGYTDPMQAAQTCAEGGWIPVSQSVIQDPKFQIFLTDNPLFGPFVELAESPNQYPIPQVPGAPMFRRTVEDAAYEAMTHPDRDVGEILSKAQLRIQQHLDRAEKDDFGSRKESFY